MNKISAEIFELQGPGQLVLKTEEIDLESIGPDEIVAKTIVSVVSPGTEIAAYTGAAPLRPMKIYPRVNGYCNVAEVVAVGSGIDDLRVGHRIATHQSHRSAFKCARSSINAILRDEDDPIALATLPLWHLGYYALLRAQAVAGMNVAIVGLGTLGLTTIAMAKMAGCSVVGLSNRQSAQAKAIEFGAKAAAPTGDISALKAWLQTQFPETGVDLVITTSNSWQDWRVALEAVRDGGAISTLGFPGRDLPHADFNPLDSRYLYDKELSIFACGAPPALNVSPRNLRFTLSRNYAYLADMLRQDCLPSREIVSDIVDYRNLDNIYKRLAGREPELLTVALQWT